MKKLLSVVIPVYNVENYLERCVESIISNTPKEDLELLEVILVDDGSPDMSPIICDNLQAKYDCVKVVHKENGGVSSARNGGIKIATGEYVTFSDSDDYVTEQFGQIFEILKRHEDVDIYSVGLKKNHSTISQFEEKTLNSKLYEHVYFFAKNDVTISCCAKIIRREFLLENQLFFPIGKKSEDYAWSIMGFLKSRNYKLLPLNYYVYDDVPTSATHTFTFDAFQSQLEFANLVYNLVMELTFSARQKKRVLSCWMETVYYAIGSIRHMEEKDKQKAINVVVEKYKHLLLRPRRIKARIFYCMLNLFGVKRTISFISG